MKYIAIILCFICFESLSAQKFHKFSSDTCIGFKMLTFDSLETKFNRIEHQELTSSNAIELIRIYNTLFYYNMGNTSLFKRLDTLYFSNNEMFAKIFSLLKMERVWGEQTIDSYSREYDIYLVVPPIPSNSFYCLDRKSRKKNNRCSTSFRNSRYKGN